MDLLVHSFRTRVVECRASAPREHEFVHTTVVRVRCGPLVDVHTKLSSGYGRHARSHGSRVHTSSLFFPTSPDRPVGGWRGSSSSWAVGGHCLLRRRVMSGSVAGSIRWRPPDVRAVLWPAPGDRRLLIGEAYLRRHKGSGRQEGGKEETETRAGKSGRGKADPESRPSKGFGGSPRSDVPRRHDEGGEGLTAAALEDPLERLLRTSSSQDSRENLAPVLALPATLTAVLTALALAVLTALATARCRAKWMAPRRKTHCGRCLESKARRWRRFERWDEPLVTPRGDAAAAATAGAGPSCPASPEPEAEADGMQAIEPPPDGSPVDALRTSAVDGVDD